jgi:hypothetical protein
MSFLKGEVENGANRHDNSSFQSGSTRGAKPQKTETRSRRAIPTTAGLDNCKSGKIASFVRGHTPAKIPLKQSLSFAEKRNLAVKRGCCFACLKPGHREKRCRAVLRCIVQRKTRFGDVHADGKGVGGKRGARGRELSVEH